MTEYEYLKISVVDNIITVRLNRESARNALSIPLMRELTHFAHAYRSKPGIRAIVLRGADQFFSAGADLQSSVELKNSDFESGSQPGIMEYRQMLLAGPDMCRAWEELEPVTIAAIEGYCVGGAVVLALCCDFRIVGADGFMRLPEVPLGMNMSWQSIPRLVSLVGPSRAKQFIMFGESLSASTLVDWGLVDVCVPSGGSVQAAMAWAKKIADLPPLPVRMTKESVNMAATGLSRVGSFMDRDQFLLTAMTEDHQEGVQAFLEKRDPHFLGR